MGCQSTPQNNAVEKSYTIDRITLNNEIDGIAVVIHEAKNIYDLLSVSYTITNNTDKAISRGAYLFTFRGYSKDGLFLFEREEEFTMNPAELDIGKKDNRTSHQKLYSLKDKVHEIVIIFDKNITWPSWRK